MHILYAIIKMSSLPISTAQMLWYIVCFISPFHANPKHMHSQTETMRGKRKGRERERYICKIYIGYVYGCDYANKQFVSPTQSKFFSLFICYRKFRDKMKKKYVLLSHHFVWIKFFSHLIKLMYHRAPLKQADVVIYHIHLSIQK